jgi:hypothetical protein
MPHGPRCAGTDDVAEIRAASARSGKDIHRELIVFTFHSLSPQFSPAGA